MKKLLQIIPIFILASCSGMQVDLENKSDIAVRAPISQVGLKVGEDGKPKAVIDSTTLFSWFGKIGRIVAGEDVKDVILTGGK